MIVYGNSLVMITNYKNRVVLYYRITKRFKIVIHNIECGVLN